MAKIHVKHMSWLMPLFLSGLMSGSLSCFNLFVWLIAYPLILIFIPLVRKVLMLIVQVPEESAKS